MAIADFYKAVDGREQFPSICIGVVVNTNDPQQMGRLQVTIPSLGEHYVHADEDQFPWASYAAPFGGVDDFSSRGVASEGQTRDTPYGIVGQTKSHVAYGMWNIPKVGAQVLLCAVDNDPNQLYWLACIFPNSTPHTLPHGRYSVNPDLSAGGVDGPFSTNESPIQPLYSNIQASFGAADSYERRSRGMDYSAAAVSSERVGLDVDQDRNASHTGTISKIPDDKELVYKEPDGKTYGKDLLYRQGYALSRSNPTLDTQTKHYKDRDKQTDKNTESTVFSWTTPGFHSMAMDDRPENNRMRFRSSTGHQILLDDTNDRIYLATNEGRNWIEMDSDGHIYAYTEQSFSVNADGDINLNSAKGKVRLRGHDGVHIETDNELRIHAKKRADIVFEEDMVLHVRGTLDEFESHITFEHDLRVWNKGKVDHIINRNLYLHIHDEDQVDSHIVWDHNLLTHNKGKLDSIIDKTLYLRIKDDDEHGSHVIYEKDLRAHNKGMLDWVIDKNMKWHIHNTPKPSIEEQVALMDELKLQIVESVPSSEDVTAAVAAAVGGDSTSLDALVVDGQTLAQSAIDAGVPGLANVSDSLQSTMAAISAGDIVVTSLVTDTLNAATESLTSMANSVMADDFVSSMSASLQSQFNSILGNATSLLNTDNLSSIISGPISQYESSPELQSLKDSVSSGLDTVNDANNVLDQLSAVDDISVDALAQSTLSDMIGNLTDVVSGAVKANLPDLTALSDNLQRVYNNIATGATQLTAPVVSFLKAAHNEVNLMTDLVMDDKTTTDYIPQYDTSTMANFTDLLGGTLAEYSVLVDNSPIVVAASAVATPASENLESHFIVDHNYRMYNTGRVDWVIDHNLLLNIKNSPDEGEIQTHIVIENDLLIHNTGQVDWVIDKNLMLDVKDSDQSVSNIKFGHNIKTSVTGSCDLSSTDDMTISSGADVNISSSSTMKIGASTLHIDSSMFKVDGAGTVLATDFSDGTVGLVNHVHGGVTAGMGLTQLGELGGVSASPSSPGAASIAGNADAADVALIANPAIEAINPLTAIPAIEAEEAYEAFWPNIVPQHEPWPRGFKINTDIDEVTLSNSSQENNHEVDELGVDDPAIAVNMRIEFPTTDGPSNTLIRLMDRTRNPLWHR